MSSKSKNLDDESTSKNSSNSCLSSSNSSNNKKKLGLVSSLYNYNQSNNLAQSPLGATRIEKLERKTITENDLLDNYCKGIPITPSDVLKLNSPTESNLLFYLPF